MDDRDRAINPGAVDGDCVADIKLLGDAMKYILIACALLVTGPAQAFIDLGFVDIPGQNVGYEARIREFFDPAPPVDYWYADPSFHIGTSFQHDFDGTTYWLTLANTIKLAPFTPPVPAVPEPATWAMMMLGFAVLAMVGRWRTR